MCFIKNKWTKFTPTQEYLDRVKGLTTVAKLLKFIQQFKRKEDVKDYWQTPEETLVAMILQGGARRSGMLSAMP